MVNHKNEQKHNNGILRSLLILAGSLLAMSAVAQGDASKTRAADLKQQRADALARAATLDLPVRVVLPDGRVAQLQRFIGKRPLYYVTDNANAADTISTDEVHAGGSAGLSLDGTGQVLGIWDGGNVRQTHQEFGGRVTNLDAASFSNHSTHVAGTMIAAGVNAGAKGMSPNATLTASDFNDDLAEMIVVQSGANPVIVSNHSYGFISGWINNFFGDNLWVWFGDVDVSTVEDGIFGYYGAPAAGWDDLTRDAPDYLIVKSSGNDRNDNGPGVGLHHHYDGSVGDFVLATDTHPSDGANGGFDTIGGGPGSAKNIVTVGAIDDIVGGYAGPGSVSMASFSGWGPTDDGRIKPDLVANGVSLTSSGSSSNTTYSTLSGTSMSTPNASGSFGALRQHALTLYGNPLRSATMRALAFHSADEAGNTGPDYSFGWGVMNTASAAQVMTNDSLGLPSDEIHEVVLGNGQSISLFFNANEPGTVRVTAAWTDPAGTPPAAGIDPPDLMLVNDIDIRLIDPNSVTHEPWQLDPSFPSAPATTGDNFRDPAEQIVVSPVVPGEYRVDITHKGALQGGAAQAVSVIISRPCCSLDSDSDEIPDDLDNCPAVANAGQENSDGDSHGDACDNCTLEDNEDQCNTNAGTDNFGNVCDADLDNNGIVNTFDLGILRSNMGQTGANDADITCNGIVNTFDLSEMRADFGQAPGPSGL